MAPTTSPARPSRPAPPAPSPSPRSPPRSPRTTRSRSRCTPTTARRTPSTASCCPLIAASEEEVKAGRNPIFQSHMWDGSAVPLDENLEIAEDDPAAHEGDQRDPRGRDRRRRRRRGRRRARGHQRALYTTLDDVDRDRRGARLRRAGPLHGRAHLRQRARRLQARQRQAAPRAAQGDPGRPPGEVRHRPQAARPRLPRRLRLDRRRDRRGRRATASSR